MNILLMLLAVYGMAFAIKESDLFDKPRMWLIRQSPFFYKLLSCYFCISFWCGLSIFALNYFNLNIVIFGFAAAAAGLIINLLVQKLLA